VRLASNAFANVTNGAATAAFQLGMTAVMARAGSARELAVWSLAASLGGLAPLLGCNLGMGVARRRAAASHASAGVSSPAAVAAVMAAARGLARRMTLLGCGAALLLGAAVPLLFPKIAADQPWASAAMVATYFAGACWLVAAQPVVGWLLDAHRNWSVAGASALARAAALTGAVALLLAGAPAWLVAAGAGGLMWMALPLMARHVQVTASTAAVDAAAQRTEHQLLLRVSLGFAAWAASSALIQGATVPLVAWLAPAVVTPFFLAFTLVTVVIGAVIAASNALVAPVARLLAAGDQTAADRLARRASGAAWLMANLTLLAVFLALPQVLALWTGTRGAAAGADAAAVRPYFALLALQHGMRSAGIVPSIVLAAGATPLTLLKAVLPESLTALLLALPLGYAFGPTGLLAGLAAAAAAGTLAACVFTESGPLKNAGGRRHALSASVAALALGAALLWLTAAGWARA